MIFASGVKGRSACLLSTPPQELDSLGAQAKVTEGSLSPEGRELRAAPSEMESRMNCSKVSAQQAQRNSPLLDSIVAGADAQASQDARVWSGIIAIPRQSRRN
jgi:hypothetical protein